MLANFFDKSKPINFIAILVLFLIYFFTALFSRFSADVFTIDFILEKLFALVLCLFLFFIFNFILSKNKLTRDNSYAFLIYVIFIGSFSMSFFDIKTLVINILMLFFLRRIYALKTNKSVFEKLFDAGFWLGIIFIIEPFYAILFILLTIGTYLFQSITLRTLLIPVLGFATPLILFFTYCFWFDNTEDFKLLFAWFTNFNFDIYLSFKTIIAILFFSLLFLFSYLVKSPKKLSISGNERKYWILLFFQTIICLASILLLRDRNESELLLLFFPMAIVITNWFEHLKHNLVKNIILIILILFPFIIVTI